MKMYCELCGAKMNSSALGWICPKCRAFRDMKGVTHRHVDTPFMPPQTNADHILASANDVNCLAELIWHDTWQEAFNIPDFSTKQELLDWLRQIREDTP